MSLCILGRQPALGLAELESLYGANAVRFVGISAALVDGEVDFTRLGGTVKAGDVIGEVQGTDPQKALLWLQKNLADVLGKVDGKLKLGVSIYGLQMSDAKLNANVLSLKNVLRRNGQSVRTVPSKNGVLSSAQSFHNAMAGERGCEILIVRDGARMQLAKLTHVQDIEAYTRRDQERPKRDTYVGMLPPKLAQIILNLAAADTRTGTVLDPFCGTGVLLQEAALMGYQVYGTDVEERMIRYTRDNLNWLQNTRAKFVHDSFSKDSALLAEQPKTNTQLAGSATEEKERVNEFAVYYETADATDHIWRKPVDIVACEGYLGHPFSSEPSQESLKETIQTSNIVMHKFLRNIAPQLKPGTRLCVAAPAWHVRDQVHSLPITTKLTELGYERVEFKYATESDLIYHRPGQVVGRELLVLVKN